MGTKAKAFTNLGDCANLPEYFTVRGCRHGLNWYEGDSDSRTAVIYLYNRKDECKGSTIITIRSGESHASVVDRAAKAICCTI